MDDVRFAGEMLRIQGSILVLISDLGRNMATQQDIDGLVDRLNTVASTVDTGVANIRADIADLKAAAPADLDFSGLESSVAGLESAASQVTSLDEENPAVPGPGEGDADVPADGDSPVVVPGDGSDTPALPTTPDDPQTGQPIGEQQL